MPLTELFNIDWRETSFVPAGDNEPARIVMWKNEPDFLTDEEIEGILQETERRAEMPTTLTKRSEVEAHVTALAKQQYPDLGEGAGRRQIWNERPDLREAYERAAAPDTSVTGAEVPVVKGADELAEHEREVQKLQTDPRVLAVSEGQRMAKARLLAWEKPGLKDRYSKALRS